MLSFCAILLSFFDCNSFYKIVGIVMVVLVMVVEALNTAIEKLCDRLISFTDPPIGLVKDVSSSAVFLSVISASIYWIWLLFFCETQW